MLSKSNSEYLSAGLATMVVFIVNAIIPSFVNGYTPGLNFDWYRLVENALSEEYFHYRSEDFICGRRLVVLAIQKWTYDIGIPYQLSFNLINLVANYCFFYFGYKLANIKYKGLNPYLFMGFLALSFPVLFAYLPVIFTYDDTVQFALLTGFFLCLYKEHRLWAYLLFFLACLSRETTVLFGAYLPLYFLFEYKTFKKVSMELVPYGVVVILYGIILYYKMGAEIITENDEYMSDLNFSIKESNISDFFRVVELTLYITASYLLPFILLWNKIDLKINRSVLFAFLSLFVVNLFLCLVAVNAIEARYYTMTLIPIFPLLAPGLQQTWDYLSDRQNFRPQLFILSILVSSIIISLYHPQVKRAYYVYGPYLFVYFSFCIYLLLLQTNRKKFFNK